MSNRIPDRYFIRAIVALLALFFLISCGGGNGATMPTRLSVILTYSDITSKDISGAATWSVSNPFTASVDSTGGVTALRTGYASVSAASGTFTATAAFVVTAKPRYLYFMSDAGQLASKAVIDSGPGQLRLTSYILTGANNYAGFHCPTTDPSSKFLYVGASIGISGGSDLQPRRGERDFSASNRRTLR